MDPLDCRSPRTCPSCEHWHGSACQLEAQIALALAPRASPAILVAARAIPALS